MKQYDRSQVKPAGDFETLPVDGYVIKITEVEDREDKETLKIEFDIAEGAQKGYYSDMYDRVGSWRGHFVKSYSTKGKPFFEAFLQAVEGSNPGFVFDWQSEKLVGKLMGVVMREEEYVGRDKDGNEVLRTMVTVDSVKTVDEIRKGKFKTKEKKLLKDAEKRKQLLGEAVAAKLEETDDDDIPF